MRKKIFSSLKTETFVVKEKSIDIPKTSADVVEIDFKELKIIKQDWALASLCVMAKKEKAINKAMLTLALQSRFHGKAYTSSLEIMEKIFSLNTL